MSSSDLASGCVIRFHFLWSREAAKGETEGRKLRPTVVGFRLRGDLLWLFPITSQEPGPGRFAKEVPETERRRAGLDAQIRSWIILDELNADRIGQSTHLEPDCRIGRFSRAFTLLVFRAWIKESRERKIRVTNRGE